MITNWKDWNMNKTKIDDLTAACFLCPAILENQRRFSKQLILVDARGQGRSDKPHKPEAYRIKEFAGDIVAVLDTLDLPQVCYMGYSSGEDLGRCAVFALCR